MVVVIHAQEKPLAKGPVVICIQSAKKENAWRALSDEGNWPSVALLASTPNIAVLRARPLAIVRFKNN